MKDIDAIQSPIKVIVKTPVFVNVESQLLGGQVAASESAAANDLDSLRRPGPRASVSEAGSRRVRRVGPASTATSLCGLATVSRSTVASRSRFGRQTLTASHSQPVMASSSYGDSSVVSTAAGQTTDTVQSENTQGRANDKG